MVINLFDFMGRKLLIKACITCGPDYLTSTSDGQTCCLVPDLRQKVPERNGASRSVAAALPGEFSGVSAAVVAPLLEFLDLGATQARLKSFDSRHFHCYFTHFAFQNIWEVIETLCSLAGLIIFLWLNIRKSITWVGTESIRKNRS